MINLAMRDIRYAWGKFLLTGLGLGLLVGVTFSMAGVYRGMVEDAKVLLGNTGADLWVVQKETMGPYAEPSMVADDVYRSLASLPHVVQVSNATYFTMQVKQGVTDVRAMIVGIEPGGLGAPSYLTAGRGLTRSHFEAIADEQTHLNLGDVIHIRRHDYTVVGLTRRMVSSGGDPMVFIPLKDAQEEQFLRDNDAIVNQRVREAKKQTVPITPTQQPSEQIRTQISHNVNAVLVRVETEFPAELVADDIVRWKHLQAYTKEQMESILIDKMIGAHSAQIGIFLVILALVSAAMVAFIIYTMTMGKIREIAVLKLIGTSNWTISAMILQQAIALGLIGFMVGKIVSSIWAPIFPKFVLFETGDTVMAFVAIIVICSLASTLAIRAALRVDPSQAIGG